MATTGTVRTLLLLVDQDNSVKIGLPPRNRMDNFYERATNLGKLKNVSHVVCSPEGELFCVRGGDLYRGPMPSNKDVDWFSVARRVGKSEWSRLKHIFFHPNGDLYGITNEGEFYKGPQPDNEHETWLYEKAEKIGTRDWQQFEAVFFDPEGILYCVQNDKFYKKAPPPNEEIPSSLNANMIVGYSIWRAFTKDSVQWLCASSEIGDGGWSRLTHFISFTPDGKLWCVDKYNGNIYKGDPPTPEKKNYIVTAEYLGWNYHLGRFLAFTKDKTIHNIISFEFLPDEGKRISEKPEVIEEKIYDNRESTSPLNHTFTFQKTIKESSSFSHEHGFTFEIGTETSFKTGVPCIAEGSTTISMNMSTTNTWNFTETNETEVTFSTTTNVELEAGKSIRMVASVVKAEINVPYKAKARTLFGSEIEIKGTWKGVSHYNLRVTQQDYNK